MFEFLEQHTVDPIIDWIESLIIHQGAYTSILLLLLEEAGVPLPIPGDVILMYTGHQVQKGTLSYPVVYIASLMAVLIGSSLLYYVSSIHGQIIIVKLGKYMHVSEHKIAFIEEQFRKYGPWVIIVGRHIPGLRIPITIFAGISDVTYKTFIISTGISVILWIPIYLSIGARLGPHTMKLFHAHPWYFLIGVVPFIFFLCSLIYVRFKNPEKKKKSSIHRQ